MNPTLILHPLGPLMALDPLPLPALPLPAIHHVAFIVWHLLGVTDVVGGLLSNPE